MNNLTASQVAAYIVGDRASLGQKFDILDRLPFAEGAHELFGSLRVTCTDDGHDMRFDIEDERR